MINISDYYRLFKKEFFKVTSLEELRILSLHFHKNWFPQKHREYGTSHIPYNESFWGRKKLPIDVNQRFNQYRLSTFPISYCTSLEFQFCIWCIKAIFYSRLRKTLFSLFDRASIYHTYTYDFVKLHTQWYTLEKPIIWLNTVSEKDSISVFLSGDNEEAIVKTAIRNINILREQYYTSNSKETLCCKQV